MKLLLAKTCRMLDTIQQCLVSTLPCACACVHACCQLVASSVPPSRARSLFLSLTVSLALFSLSSNISTPILSPLLLLVNGVQGNGTWVCSRRITRLHAEGLTSTWATTKGAALPGPTCLHAALPGLQTTTTNTSAPATQSGVQKTTVHTIGLRRARLVTVLPERRKPSSYRESVRGRWWIASSPPLKKGGMGEATHQ